MDQVSSLPSAEEIRAATRRNSNLMANRSTSNSNLHHNMKMMPSSHDESSPSPGSGSPMTHKSMATMASTNRRSSSIADEDVVKTKELYSKLSLVLSERAKLNPGLKDPRLLSFQNEDGEMSNILKAESQFAPSINFNGEFTMADAVNEELDCALMDAIDNYGHPTFLPEDEDVLILFFREVSNKLHGTNGKSFSRRRGTKLTSLVQMDAALLEGYSGIKSYFSSIHHVIQKSSSGKTIKPSPPSPVGDTATFNKWSFDPFVHSDAELMEYAFQMINEFGLIEKFSINVDKLRTLIATAKKNYRPNAFHNFYHAFGVMHLSYLILQRGAAEYLTPLDILATLVGALLHDLDHPGNNNAFEVASGSELANIYSDDAVLERYHVYMAHKIMKATEADILANLTQQERAELRANMAAGIMATDMSRHFQLTEKLALCSKSTPPFHIEESASRSALVGFIIHCADIGAQTQKKELALKWGQRVLEEFRQQAKNEEKLKIPTAPFMQGLDQELACMKLQQGFVAGIVIPLWTALTDCLPKLKPCLDRAVLMKQHYEGRVHELSPERPPTPRGSGSTKPPSR